MIIASQKYNTMGNLGWVQIVLALLPIIITLVEQGYSYYSAIKTAKQMQANQRLLTREENEQLARALHREYPKITFSEWYDYVVLANLIYPPLPTTPNGNTPKPKTETNYWTYLAIFTIILVVTKK